MWYGASIAHMLDDAKGYGFDVSVNGFSWATLVEKREQYIRNINEWYISYLGDDNIDLLTGRAKFVDAHTLDVGGVHYSADRIVIAPGGQPVVPTLPGADLGISSDGFCPASTAKKVAVVGAGYIAVELAGMLNALGSDVSQIIRKQHFLREFDPIVYQALDSAMRDSGVNIVNNTQIASLEKTGDSITIHTEGGESLSGFDQVIWAIGRTPLSAGLNLAGAGVNVDARGYIPTDLWQATNVEGVFALGDVTGRAQLTPVAIAAGGAWLIGSTVGRRNADSTMKTSRPWCLATHQLAQWASPKPRRENSTVMPSRYTPVSSRPCTTPLPNTRLKRR